MINWEDDTSYIFQNPKSVGESLPNRWEGFSSLKGHIWLATSGSTKKKWVALSKEALLTSAQAVNSHFEISKNDTFVNVLPTFHVGGLSIYARAHLSKSKVITVEERWDSIKYYQTLEGSRGTLTSLVPTQVFDLVEKNIQAPSNLRAVIVGGGALSRALFEKAKKLNWPLFLSYGMTECSSQIATAKSVKTGDLTLLPHIEALVNEDGFLKVKSKGLLTGYLEDGIWKDPKIDGWFTTSDKVILSGNTLKFLGRDKDLVKISGENVSLIHLRELFESITGSHPDMVLTVKDDERLGKQIIVAVKKGLQERIEAVIKEFNKKVMPYERIREVKVVDEIPRSSIGKVLSF